MYIMYITPQNGLESE